MGDAYYIMRENFIWREFYLARSTHSHPSDGVAADQLPHGLPLVPAEVEPHAPKGPPLGAEGSSLWARERYEMIRIHAMQLVIFYTAGSKNAPAMLLEREWLIGRP